MGSLGLGGPVLGPLLAPLLGSLGLVDGSYDMITGSFEATDAD